MIEVAVASTLMRLPVAELSELRKVFLASPAGLSLEGFVAAMLPSTNNEAAASGSHPQPQQHQPETTHFRRQSTKAICRRSPSTAEKAAATPPSTGQGHRKRKKRRKTRGKRSLLGGRSTSSSRRGDRARDTANQLGWAGREGSGGTGGVGWSLSEEERIGVVTDLVELFQQVDHNGDQVMEWEEFTGFVIDQVLALTREAPRADRLKVRSLGARDKPSASRLSVKKVRYDKDLACVFSCAGPVVEVWDPAMRKVDAMADGANTKSEGLSQRGTGTVTNTSTSAKGFFAYSPSEETSGFEIGSSAALPGSDDDIGSSSGGLGKGKGHGGSGCNTGSRRSLHGANPSKNRDGAPVNVAVLDIKYIKALKLLMVLRSDLTLAFFLADNNYLRVGLAKTRSQQYVLEYCAMSGLAFTSGCDGDILSFAIETSSSSSNEGDNQPHLLATATPVGVLRRHTDVVQDLLAVSGTEAEGGQRLVSCGLDRRVCVWDVAKGAFAQSKHGNRAAIRSLAFDPSDNLLLGAGMEGEVLAWDMWARLGAPLFRMQGHRSPVRSVACAPGKGRAASLDDTGKMCVVS